MADTGGGDPGTTNADLAALPPELSKQSLSRAKIILPLDAAIQAIDVLAHNGRRLETWEGWVHMRDGGRARSLTYGGSFALPREARRAAETAAAAMRKAKAAWDRNPEYPGAELWFGLTFGAS